MLRGQSVMLGSAVAVGACWSLACGSSLSEPPEGDGSGSVPPFSGVAAGNDGEPSDGVGAAANDATSGVNFGVSDDRTSEVQVVCAAQSAASELRQVALAFLFDVSASMTTQQTRRRSSCAPRPVVGRNATYQRG